MSRPLKLVTPVLLLAAGGAVALAAGSAPAHSRSQKIICPLEPSGTVTTTCCGPPVLKGAASAPICCGTPQPIACPVALTLSSSANPSTEGQGITLTGRWPGNTAGQAVELFQELPGASTFSPVAHTTTGSLGSFQFVREGVKTNRKWYVSVGSEQSLTLEQRVRAVVTLAGRHGRVSPNHSGERVTIQARVGSGWTVIARPRLSRASTFSLGSAHGELRAVFPGDWRNIRSVSRQVVLHG